MILEKKENPKISLIVPVYNVESYLEKSLESVVNQTFKDFEVIAVNDGSTDSSYSILKNYANKYSNFVILNKENGGLSDARNAGLKIARGDYIAFLDSDDYLHPSFLETLYDLVIKNDADISACNLSLYYPKSGMKFPVPTILRDRVYDKRKALKKLISDCFIHHFAWNKLCKRSIFEDNNIYYYDMYFEDMSTSPRLFYNADKVAITNKSYYYYTQRSGSIMKTINAETINDFMLAAGMIRNYLEEKGEYSVYKNIYTFFTCKVRFLTYLHVVKMHLASRNPDGLMDNLRGCKKNIDYFKSNDYLVKKSFTLAYTVKAPVKKSRKKEICEE